MERRKTTVYLDPDVLTAAKVLAAARQQSESQVVEDALRAYLGSGRLEAARSELRELMNRLAARDELTDEQAMKIAVSEVRAARTARRTRRTA
jgi:predicted transcriptional regulator